ncbi:hypothetical protein [Actinomycetospora corticicola]|uniref:Uncharacterized protein n=1 Tax=Actinomycetospora corticicola TaxID=663602 RepID=A0A7Y9J3X8_9PSEU|nr:hypothetical protein [Actinomycetospora corticicola]NYD34538.1 hypothetical protein [Actinomycetospora corticicola]
MSDRATSTIGQSDDLASFVRAGGRVLHRPGQGDLYDQCEAREVDLVSGSDQRALTSCANLHDDGGVSARQTS